jgi:hypothetical protein
LEVNGNRLLGGGGGGRIFRGIASEGREGGTKNDF